ncbi:uncharacterized protein ttc34 [Amia ocellicauda]|uniref:uncharacterized protein ttc34 n=1 Tax=Amia ocellicauda TaxID=2972642 RepID=UPI003463A624
MAAHSSEQGAGVPELCREGDKLLGAGELGRATAVYTSAFRAHAGVTVSHMRRLGVHRLTGVISTLEAWLGGSGEAQDLAEGSGLNKGLAAVFLSTLSPNNLSASLFKMESVLQGAGRGCEEVATRCSALLEGKQEPEAHGSARLALRLTRALACLLAQPQSPHGLELYLQAFQEDQAEAVRLVKCRQGQHLPRIVDAFLQQLSLRSPDNITETGQDGGLKESGVSAGVASEYLHFLVAIAPDDTHVQELQAAALFQAGRFEESAQAYSLALGEREAHTETLTGSDKAVAHWLLPERKAGLLVGRAAAHFSAGGRAVESCRDLGEAFGTHPAAARLRFQEMFSDRGAGASARAQLRQQAERGLCGYREAVLGRPDLRSSHGVELLDPVIAGLRALCHLEPGGGGRELRVRLADCLLLRGESKEALSICSQLAAASPTQQSYQNTVQVLRGFARLLSDDQQGALEDFQAVIEHSAPHPSSCVRALCGRGLLRLLGDAHYLAALDYLTASRLQPQEAALTVRCLVPWNQRGLLCTVLLEQGRAMLEGPGGPTTSPQQQSDQLGSRQLGHDRCSSPKEGTAVGVHALALLLMELEPDCDAPRILAADALYRLGRVEEAYRLLLSTGPSAPRAPVLARLALLQLHRGFLYDANQLLKKLTQCGDTSCLLPLLAVAEPTDRALLQENCHTAATRVLESRGGEGCVREAVAYLSIAIIASGGVAVDSLMARARCYALLGQRRTAIFDFSAILREHAEHVAALCGRGFTYLTLQQQKECTQDIVAALQVDAAAVTQDVLSLKEAARKLVCDWLHQHCRAGLSEITAANPVPCGEELLSEAFLIGGALMKVDSRNPRWHILYVDTLLAKGAMKPATAHLRQVFGQEPREAEPRARWGLVEMWRRNPAGAARGLSQIAQTEPSSLNFLLSLLSPAHRKHLAQAAAQEAGSVSEHGQWEPVLALLTVAVRAAGEGKPRYLRQRAACLARLGLHERAVSDLDRVIQSHSGVGEDPRAWAEDLCRRGHSLLLCSREEPGLEDFAQALDLHQAQALACVEAGLGRPRVAECFLQGALRRFGERQLGEAWRLSEYGLRVEDSHVELRRLRARIKRDATGSCIVN